MITRLIIAISLLTSVASATDRYFRDQTDFNPNGALRLEAKSPDNAQGMPFARDFVYTLYDVNTETILWQRSQPNDERSPIMVFVHDNGWVVVRDFADGIFSLKPFTGEATHLIDIRKEFTEQENQTYVSNTTAGPMWTRDGTTWRFVDHDDQTYFIVRTWWGKRLVADLEAGKRLDTVPEELKIAFDNHDRAFAIAALKQGITPGDHQSRWDVFAACCITTQLRVAKAVPLLRDIDAKATFDSDYASTSDPSERPFSYRVSRIRLRAHQALRSLGEEPTNAPAYFFPWRDPDSKPAHESPAIGHDARDVLATLGEPDFIAFRGHWDFDQQDKTLRVHFARSGGKVSKLETIDTPDPIERMEQIMLSYW